MRKSRSDALLFVGIASWLTIACTSGIGQPANNFDDPYESAPNSRESPGAGRESPGPGREAPPVSGENPGSQGGGPGTNAGGSGTANACPPCDQKFSCITVTNGKTDDDNVELKTKNGVCTIETLVFECGGKLTLQGKSIGTWQANGAGFSATATSTEGTSTITCVPRSSPPTPTPTPTPTLTVSPTAPAPPPPVVDAGIKDSGTKG